MDELLEQLAEREHQQWNDWTAYMLDNLTPENIQRWRSLIATPYSDLSEHSKESDRIEARKILAIIEASQSEER